MSEDLRRRKRLIGQVEVKFVNEDTEEYKNNEKKMNQEDEDCQDVVR